MGLSFPRQEFDSPMGHQFSIRLSQVQILSWAPIGEGYGVGSSVGRTLECGSSSRGLIIWGDYADCGRRQRVEPTGCGPVLQGSSPCCHPTILLFFP